MFLRRFLLYLSVFLTCFILLYANKASLFKKPSYERVGSSIPKFRFSDINGSIINLGKYSGKNVYIQFLDPDIETDFVLERNVWRFWQDYNLIFILFPKSISDKIMNLLKEQDHLFIASPAFCQQTKKLLKSPSCCEQYFIYDINSRLFAKGNNIIGYESAVKRDLEKLLNNKSFKIELFSIENININELVWFHQILKIMDLNRVKIYIVGLFSNICNNCHSGDLIRILNSISSNFKDIFVFSILAKNYSESDSRNLKNSLNINYAIYLADDILDHKWQALIKEYDEADVNNIIIILDSSGRIIKTFYEGCHCYDEIINLIEKLAVKNEIK